MIQITGEPDAMKVASPVRRGLVGKVPHGEHDGNSLACYPTITPSFTDWADVRHVAHSSGELHIALERMWQSLWANVSDEISRAQGLGSNGGFFGLPSIEIEDLTAPVSNGGIPAPNGNGSS